MQRGAEVLEPVRRARSDLAQVQSLLHSPTAAALERCGGPLEEAVACLKSLEEKLRGPEGEWVWRRAQLRWELEELRRDIQRVSGLLENAAVFYTGWGQILAAAKAAGGYTAGGRSAPEPPAQRLLAEA